MLWFPRVESLHPDHHPPSQIPFNCSRVARTTQETVFPLQSHLCSCWQWLCPYVFLQNSLHQTKATVPKWSYAEVRVGGLLAEIHVKSTKMFFFFLSQKTYGLGLLLTAVIPAPHWVVVVLDVQGKQPVDNTVLCYSTLSSMLYSLLEILGYHVRYLDRHHNVADGSLYTHADLVHVSKVWLL